MPYGIHLSDATIWEWVNSATRNVLERHNAVEAISLYQRDRGGYVTLSGLEALLQSLIDDEEIQMSKYTVRYMLENLPEELA